MNRFEVIVELKSEVLDPQGRAIQQTLARLGRADVQGVKASKRFVLDLGPDCQNPEAEAQKIAKEFLANPVSEICTVRRLER